MNKRILVWMACMLAVTLLRAQSKPDSVIIKVGEASKVVFTIGDKKDLQTLKQYDFQAVVNDLVKKLEANDSTQLDKPAENYVQPSVSAEPAPQQREEDWDDSWRNRDNNDRDRYVYRDQRVDKDQRVYRSRRYYGRRTYHSFNLDLGTNNYLENEKFPDQNALYTVRPWGSWYVGLNSVRRTRIARVLFAEWGLGASWYNFKFQNENVFMRKDATGVTFEEDTRPYEFKKSKLTALYLNASFVPMLDFGGNRRKAMFFDGDHSESFRFGAGPYVGYRIDSYSKQEYKIEGDKNQERNRDNYYLNNIRYGIRAQIGLRDTDLFFCYDMNELFSKDKGPKLNAFSFGISF
jgi:hypothetical protein